MVEVGKVYRVLVEKREERHLGRSRRRWDEGSRMDVRKSG
jgi:hypothetical protein